MINCSISSLQAAETLSTLRFGRRARCLTCSAKGPGEDAGAGAMPELARTLRAARLEIERLRLLTSERPCSRPIGRAREVVDEDAEYPNSAPWSRSSTPPPSWMHANAEASLLTLDGIGKLDDSALSPIPHSAPPAPTARLPLSCGPRPPSPTSAALDLPVPCLELSPRKDGERCGTATGLPVQPRRLD